MTAVVVGTLLALPAAADGYKFNLFDLPDNAVSIPVIGFSDFGQFAINAGGQVTGSYVDSDGHTHGFLKNAGSLSVLNAPGASSTHDMGINAGGQIVGSYKDAIGTHGFVYSGGTYQTIDGPGSNYTEVTSINDNGDIGWSYYDANFGDWGINYAFVRSGGSDNLVTSGGPIWLSSLNVSGQVAVNFNYHGFYGTYLDPYPPGSSYWYTISTGINASGQVVGTDLAINYENGDAVERGFIYNAGSYTLLQVPGSDYSTFAAGINDNGQVVGIYHDAVGYHGFVYSGGLYTTLNAPGASQTFATGINASGQVAGYYYDATGVVHGFIAAVPEPGEWAMLMSGIPLVGWQIRRKQTT